MKLSEAWRALFDHYIGCDLQRQRDSQAERLGSLHIDYELDFCGLIDRQIGWLLAVENAGGIDAKLAGRIGEAAASRVGSRRGSGFE